VHGRVPHEVSTRTALTCRGRFFLCFVCLPSLPQPAVRLALRKVWRARRPYTRGRIKKSPKSLDPAKQARPCVSKPPW